jgi:drug/metabolite transporter (DMT)-like permease
MNRFALGFTPFTLLMASLASLNGFALTFCSFKALNRINLSLYSLFMMLGGMALPFLQGILFYGEPLTVAKGVCFAIITLALACTVTRGEGKSGVFYYTAIFLLNGMSGVLTKLFTAAPYPKANAASYSMWSAIVSVAVASVLLCAMLLRERGRESGIPRFTWLAGAVQAAHGGLNKVANFILVLALAHVDASIQYPMVTGGTIIVSTLICYLGDRRPSRRELASVALAFIGMLALFLIPV